MTTFPHTTVYALTYAGRLFFYFYLDGIETPLSAIEFTGLVTAGAKIVNL